MINQKHQKKMIKPKHQKNDKIKTPKKNSYRLLAPFFVYSNLYLYFFLLELIIKNIV